MTIIMVVYDDDGGDVDDDDGDDDGDACNHPMQMEAKLADAAGEESLLKSQGYVIVMLMMMVMMTIVGMVEVVILMIAEETPMTVEVMIVRTMEMEAPMIVAEMKDQIVVVIMILDVKREMLNSEERKILTMYHQSRIPRHTNHIF